MHILKRVAIGVGVLLLLLLAYGVVVERFFVLDAEPEIVAEVPGLPSVWNGKRVGVIADIHIGMWLGNPGMSRRAVRELIRRRPDLVLIAGDFVSWPEEDPERIREAAAIVRPLAEAGIPTFAVLGNHDYSIFSLGGAADTAIANRVAAAVEQAGIPVLRNAAVPVRTPVGPPLYVVGIDSNWAERDRPAEALAGVPAGAPRIVFMHNPSSFKKIRAGAAPFAVAAHTHGGDIRIPGTPDWSWLDLIQGRRIPADSWAPPGFGQPGNHVYINRGVGNSTAPLRINDPPEITLFVLRGAAR